MYRSAHSSSRSLVVVLLVAFASVSLAVSGSSSFVAAQTDDKPPDRVRELPDGSLQREDPLAAASLARVVVHPSQTCAAAPPTLLSPAQGSVSNDLRNPRYTWTAVPGITEYVFQLAQDSAFASLLTTEQETASPEQSQVTNTSFEDLEPTTTYFWRVASVCSDGQIGPFSAPASFQTGSGNSGATCSLPPPTLAEPANGAQVQTLVPRIVWNRAPNTFEYRYQLSTRSDFSSLIDNVNFIGIDPTRTDGVVEIPDDNLLPDTVYYWRVASVCAEIDALSAFSTPFSFRAGPAGGALPAPPQLVAPENNATTGSIRISFLFSPVAGADAYRVLLYRSQTNAEQDRWFRALGSTSTTRIEVRNPQETVFWRVKSRNSYGWGNLSEIRSFTTPTVNASADITPEAGGTLTPTPGYLTVSIPPGAVDAPTRVDFRLLASPQQRLANFRFANRAFTLEAFAGTQEITRFNKPITLVVTYDASDLLVAGIGDATQLKLLYWDGTVWQNLLPCDGCSVDTTNRKVTVVLDHFTEFALAAPGTEIDVRRILLPVVFK